MWLWAYAGENVDIIKACKQEGVRINFKYTAPGTPQQNGWVKQKFDTLFNWVCAMLNGKNFFLYYKMAYEPKLPTLPCFLKIISSLPIKT